MLLRQPKRGRPICWPLLSVKQNGISTTVAGLAPGGPWGMFEGSLRGPRGVPGECLRSLGVSLGVMEPWKAKTECH